MRRLILAAALLMPTAAMAQQAPTQPSDKALIMVLHQQLQQAQDALTVAEAHAADLQQQLAAAKEAATKPDPKKDH
jgi:hypothetical protein